MEGLTEGRIVHYVLQDGRSRGEHRPAIIVKVWSQEDASCNLLVFTDKTNDGYDDPVQWVTSRCYEASGIPGSWHWIEKA